MMSDKALQHLPIRPVGICPSPECGASIPETHPYPWCSACGNPLPETIQAMLPRMLGWNPEAGTPASAPVPEAVFWKQCAGIGAVSLLLVLIGGFRALVLVVPSLLVFADAWLAGIRRRPGNSDFNMSPGVWGLSVMILPPWFLPAYLANRDKYATRSGSSAVWLATRVAGWCLLAYGLIILLLTIVDFPLGEKARLFR